jgi:hypothetical protein
MTTPISQVNTSGGPLHVPALGRDISPGEPVDYPELLPGFTATGKTSKPTTGKTKPDQLAEPAVADAPTKES